MDPALLQRQHDLFHALTRRGITLFASSGDQGAGQFACDGSYSYFKATSTPASDPYVTSVGGTALTADGTSGAYQSETTWNESTIVGDAFAGGGGESVIYRQPDYQSRVVHDRMRTVPDVSYNAAVFQGVIAVWDGGYYRFGGTSVGSPQWAGLIAIADQLPHGRAGAINTPLYNVGRSHFSRWFFHDVADGSNNSIPDVGVSGTPIDGFTAVPGYDMATGLGTPIANTLVPYLAHNASRGDENYGGNEHGGHGNGNGDGGHGGHGGGGHGGTPGHGNGGGGGHKHEH